MTTNSPNPVDGDVQALIADCQAEIEDLKRSIDRCDAIGTSDYLHHLQSKLKRQYAALDALTAEPVEWQLQCFDETVPEENRWFDYERYKHKVTPLKNQRVIEYYTTPPAQLLRPVGLPEAFAYTIEGMEEYVDGWWLRKDDVIEALRQQGYEVKRNDNH